MRRTLQAAIAATLVLAAMAGEGVANAGTGQDGVVLVLYTTFDPQVGGEVLEGSAFCIGGTHVRTSELFGHGSLLETRAFVCPDGTFTLRMRFYYAHRRIGQAYWDVIDGTGAYASLEGSGGDHFKYRFPAPDEVDAREVLRGTYSS